MDMKSECKTLIIAYNALIPDLRERKKECKAALKWLDTAKENEPVPADYQLLVCTVREILPLMKRIRGALKYRGVLESARYF